MTENLFIQSIDEFNYTSCVNFFDEEQSPANVLCLPGFEILFYNFKKIIVSKLQKTSGLLLSSDLNLKEHILNELKKESLKYKDSYLTQSDLKTNGLHIYKYMFYNLAKDMLNTKQEIYKPKEKDYIYVHNKFKHIDKKIVAINGRI